MTYPPYPHPPAAVLTTPNRLIYRVCCPLPPHHQYLKANRSRLAFFIAGACVFAGGFCGTLRTSPHSPIACSGPHSTLSCPSSLASPRVNSLDSASAKISLFKKISGLLADFSSGWMVSLPGRRKSLTAATIGRRTSGIVASACPIRLMMSCAKV